MPARLSLMLGLKALSLMSACVLEVIFCAFFLVFHVAQIGWKLKGQCKNVFPSSIALFQSRDFHYIITWSEKMPWFCDLSIKTQ